jgi:pimeloyl-ACP methyl ester carboxylesterase
LGLRSAAAEPLIKQMMTTTDFRYSMYLPPVYTDEQLRQINVPTLLLLGDHEIIYDYKAALKRAASLMPDIETAVVPDAGHALSLDQPEMVNRRILEFLGQS